MKYLITGNKGFIGTNLTNYLQSRNEEVIGIDYPIDLCCIQPLPKSDIIVHLAAETNVRDSILDPNKVFIRNCQSTINLLNHAKEINSRFIFASSCGAISPINPYAASKTACESLCIAYRKSYNMDISILRFSNVYGPYSKHKDSVITKFIKQKLNNEPVTINGSGHQMRDFIHVQDICKAIYECSDNFAEISTGRLTSINTITEMLDIKDVIYDSPIEGEVFHPKTVKWPGYQINLKDGLKSTLKWFQEN